jgi:hypothetical protein
MYVSALWKSQNSFTGSFESVLARVSDISDGVFDVSNNVSDVSDNVFDISCPFWIQHVHDSVASRLPHFPLNISHNGLPIMAKAGSKKVDRKAKDDRYYEK